MENRAAHLIGENIDKNQEDRTLRPEKLDWVGAVEKTISDAQVRVTNGPETFYFRNYAEGTHMVIVEDGAIKDQYALVTQYAPELSKRQFRGALVERVRPVSGLAPQGGPGAIGIPRQPQSQAVQTPQPGAQDNTTTEEAGSQSHSLSPAAWLNQAARAAGYSSAEFLEHENKPLHDRLQAQWQAYHGNDEDKKRSQDNAINDIDNLLYGTSQHSTTPSRRPSFGHSRGEARTRLETAHHDYRRVFGTSAPPTGSPAGGPQARTAQRRRERAWLVDWARERRVLIQSLPPEWALDGAEDVGQMEHHVFLHGDRVIKLTLGVGEYFGMWPVAHQGTWDMRREEASIINYLESAANANALFGDDIAVHGVHIDRDGGVRLVISQPTIRGDSVDTNFIGKTMREQGFVQLVPPSSFYRASDNTAVIDLHQENAVRVGDLLLPFDVKVLHPKGALRENLERAAAAAAK
ncbi:hypothetical protein [Roseimicrobium sp. ORNL1]|uniref:hypothetical protein n=1 Tax=Roseimicrobium sp. ORNL1 TaxID=2711231 RepID=UPI0013E1C364|nr:hypothetical protein [Roseimicrobium sp. ORNL1]QIF01917.1 hypothetical protein G5S37_10380 [Roseimicrobium sp. ORNL1]